MNIYFVRHGETEWNQTGRRQGQLDSPLTEKGIEQVRAVAERLSDKAIEAIFSSPLGRSRQSASLISERIDVEVQVVQSLAEVHHGKWAGWTSTEIEQKYPGEREQRKNDWYRFRFEGGESYADAENRMTPWLNDLLKSEWNNVLVVSHEMIGRTMLGRLLQLPSTEWLQIRHPHGLIYKMEVTEKSNRLGYFNTDGDYHSGWITRKR